jgi:hypothetical protein
MYKSLSMEDRIKNIIKNLFINGLYFIFIINLML